MNKDTHIKFIYVDEHNTITFSVNPETTYPDLLDTFERFAMAMGYQPHTINAEKYDNKD